MRKILLNTVLLLTTLTLIHCGEDDPKIKTTLAELTTTTVSNITATSAKSGGTVTSDGGKDVVARGVCWSTTPNPTVANDKTINGEGSGNFISDLTDLSDNTTYYVRAYASNAHGTAYGTSEQFTTGEISLATVTTTTVTNIRVFTAKSGGTITSDGGGTITARGVCWSTNENPTIADSKITNGEGVGAFVSELTEFAPKTTYYLRAYATNGAGTAYGEQIDFITSDEYSGIYEVITGTVFRGLVDGSADPAQSGNYAAGMTMDLDGILFGQDTVRFFPMYTNGGIAGLDPTIAIIDRSITSPDGSHPVKIMCLVNETLKNIPGTESKFFPGSPGTRGETVKQEFVLNLQWQIGGIFNRNITNLRIRFKAPFNGE